MKEEAAKIKAKEQEYEKWEQRMEKIREREKHMLKKNQEGLERYRKQMDQRARVNSHGQNTNFGPMGKPVRYIK